MTKRDWIVYYNDDGEPWAIFLEGHDYDLRTLQSLACKEEMRQACCDPDDRHFQNNLNIGRWWIRDAYEAEEDDADPDHPWIFCDKNDLGAKPITGAKFE